MLLEIRGVSNIMKTQYFAISLDPIHIGAGGYRLGMVDNTIVREPSTDVPKIPGTSLAGAIREYAKINIMESELCGKEKTQKEREECAEEKIREYFGHENRQGVFRFYDGQIIFFPIPSTYGTIWVTTKSLLLYWMCTENKKEQQRLAQIEIKDKAYFIKRNEKKTNKVDFGWVCLEADFDFCENDYLSLPTIEGTNLLNNIAIVSDKLFTHLVNDNLEVRTSVRIDSETGAAVEGALFTYEAIPRATLFGFEIIQKSGVDKITGNKLLQGTFPLLELLGVGGMGTRGFGRIKVFDNESTNAMTNGGEANG